MSEHLIYTLRVNGKTREVSDSWIGESLLYVLRERLGLPGTKGACEQGECGSCTVFMDGDAVCSCLVMAASAVETDIVTIENFGEADLSDVQQSFITEGGVQCGFCTPGLVMAVHHLLEHHENPTDEQIKESISGNLCRCTGYGRIFEAVRATVRTRSERR
jgi:carbon-monoxide dehydrogenase small subunit